MKQYIPVLRKTKMFSGVGDEEIESMLSCLNARVQHYKKGEYVLRLRLYELEKRLPSDQFVRISNSEIINLKKVNSFDLSLTGTICVRLSNGTTTYVSRRYVSKLKKILGI